MGGTCKGPGTERLLWASWPRRSLQRNFIRRQGNGTQESRQENPGNEAFGRKRDLRRGHREGIETDFKNTGEQRRSQGSGLLKTIKFKFKQLEGTKLLDFSLMAISRELLLVSSNL